MLQIFVFFLYFLIVFSLIWARLRFFKMDSGTALPLALSYDLAVAAQMLATAWSFYSVTDITKPALLFSGLLYMLSLMIFWWSIVTAKSLDFAFSSHVGNIVTSGPFGLFRHPFYVSYMVAWFSSTFLFNSLILWITLVYLVAFYVLSARKEERTIMLSEQAEKYQLYKRNVGMFLPRIKKWKH